MVIHKLMATCSCDREVCIGHGDGSVVNITLSANSERDIAFLGRFITEFESCFDRVEKVTIRIEDLQLMRDALEDVYRLPEFAQRTLEAIGLTDTPKEEENPFKDLEDLELKEIG